MRRKRIVAKLLALSLLFSGLPMASVYAAELPDPAEAVEQEAEGKEVIVEDSGIEDTDEKETDSAQNEAQDEKIDETRQGNPEEVETADETEESSPNDGETAVKELRVAENVRMAGSNGIFYDGVTYLSARNVLAMDGEAQEVYRSLCDGIAASMEGGLEMQDIIFAVDANGNLYCSYYVPMRALEEIEADMLPDADGTLTPEAEEIEAEEKKDAEVADDDKDAVEEEKKDNETSEDSKDTVGEEKKDGETSEDGKDAVEEEQNAETSEDGGEAVEEEQQDAEAVEEEKTAEEESDELFEENMDLIPEMAEETFEEIESVRIENTIDLGYGVGVSDGLSRNSIQFNAILPTEDYFVKQLSSTQKTYYDAAKGNLTKGSNKFSYKGSIYLVGTIGDDVAHAVSALILAYPDKTDWMAKPGGFSVGISWKEGSSVATYTFMFDKSKYYNGSLDSKAKTQVQTVGNLAQQYAADNYPKAPVYGIVKYFDQWVCENGYYNNLGMIPYTGDVESDKQMLWSKYEISVNSTQLNQLYNIYYKCHSAYGILLEGSGVCESYAKTMSRLLDAVGIPNIYVVGTAGSGRDAGGHAWNYVQMPNGSWYLLDSTWNDNDDPTHNTSAGNYVLVKEDGEHHESGCNYGGEDEVVGKFSFPTRATSNYSPDSNTETVALSQTELNLVPKGKEILTYKINGKPDFGKVSGVWSSDNVKVAKVDQKGNVTAVAAGVATITFTAAGMTGQCTVNVDQVKAVKTEATNKTSESVSLGNTDKAKGSASIKFTVDRGDSPHTAEWMIKNGKVTAPAITCTKKANKDVVTATAKVAGDTITVNVTAVDNGSSRVTVKFGGKTVTINVTAGTIIEEKMFDITWPAGETSARTYAYTGRAIKPAVKKKADVEYKAVTFKATYVNNINAGTAKVVITGIGKYGGVLEYEYKITPLDITGADFSKALKSKAYDGGDNPPATVVKLAKKSLKVNKDYEILYTGGGLNCEKPKNGVLPVGKYTVTIQGIGNYTGKATQTQSYEVTQNVITRVTVTGAASANYTGLQMKPYTVKIGKNVLPDTDYTITWYQGQGKTKSTTAMKNPPAAKGKYTAVIKVRGGNLINTAKKTEITKNFTIR